ncbi:MAG: hypothetical protein QM731_05215 [Chitinophagaceae bacterium]
MTTPETTLTEIEPSEPGRVSLGWREVYAGILVLILGVIYLALQISSHASSLSQTITTKGDALIVDRKMLFLNLRNYIYILVAIIGSILLFKRRLFGWIATLAILGLAIVITSSGIVYYIYIREFTLFFQIFAGIEFLLLLALLFLCLPSARKKFRAGKVAFIPALLLLGLLIGLFLLQ